MIELLKNTGLGFMDWMKWITSAAVLGIFNGATSSIVHHLLIEHWK